MRYVQVCLCASSDQEGSFHHCGGPVKLVQACLGAETHFNAVLTAEGVL